MSELVQDALAVLIVLGAAGFLVWRRVRARAKPTPYCGDCPGCAPDPATPAETPLVRIGEPPRGT